MSITSSTYVPKLEALHSLMIGIALTLVTLVLAAVLMGLLDRAIWHAAGQHFHTHGVIKTIQTVFFGLLAAIFSLGLWYATLLLFALPQFFFIVLPLLKIFSTGLKGDAHRNWGFYVILGVLTGGLPWLGLAYVLFGNSMVFNGTLKLFVLPAFLIGAIAGGVLKYRLTKLAAAERIENDGV